MSYLQRLLETAPAGPQAVSVAPGDAAPSPIVAQDQRLASFPSLLDPGFAPLDGVPDTEASAEQGPEDLQTALMPVRETAEYPSPPADPAPLNQGFRGVDIGSVILDLGERETVDPPLTERRPEPEIGVAQTETVETVTPAEPYGAEPQAPSEPLQTPVLEQPAEPSVPSREPFDQAAPVEPPRQNIQPLWPITEADFEPHQPDPTIDATDQAPSQPMPTPRPAQDLSPPEPVVQPVAEAPLFDPLPLEPAMDLAPSPLAGLSETQSQDEAGLISGSGETVREVHTIERVVEQSAPPADPPAPMTAASVSVIGPISIGRAGPREMRARRWG